MKKAQEFLNLAGETEGKTKSQVAVRGGSTAVLGPP
jgi:hypothetical protein